MRYRSRGRRFRRRGRGRSYSRHYYVARGGIRL